MINNPQKLHVLKLTKEMVRILASRELDVIRGGGRAEDDTGDPPQQPPTGSAGCG